MTKRLGKQEWIHAALQALSAHGVDSVRVERLAEALHVTKGSFYWHFANRDSLLAAALEAWETRATNDVIAIVEAGGGNAEAKLRSLGAKVFNADGRLDRHVRAWAGIDPVARRAQDNVDQHRLSYTQSLFLELGLTPVEAIARSTLLYHALVGQFTMGERARPDKEQLTIMFELLSRT